MSGEPERRGPDDATADRAVCEQLQARGAQVEALPADGNLDVAVRLHRADVALVDAGAGGQGLSAQLPAPRPHSSAHLSFVTYGQFLPAFGPSAGEHPPSVLRCHACPDVGPPRRPRRIRVADPALATELRTAIGDRIPITVAPTPELDRVVQVMARTLPADGEVLSYLEGGRVSEASVESLFGAARMLYHAAPWRIAADSQIVRIDVPAIDIRGACLSIIFN